MPWTVAAAAVGAVVGRVVGVQAGFALVMALSGGLFTAEWTLLPADAWTVVGLVVAPLAAALGGVAETDTVGAASPRRLGVAAVTGIALGVGTASVYAAVSGRRTLELLSSQLDTLAADAVVTAAVLLLAAVAGVAARRD